MVKNRRRHTVAFKVRVALEAAIVGLIPLSSRAERMQYIALCSQNPT